MYNLRPNKIFTYDIYLEYNLQAFLCIKTEKSDLSLLTKNKEGI